jgi:two-component system sensor histidine kinase PilS (NtrC family)
LLDLILITWLVRGTGDITSPYVTLYIFLISAAGFFVTKADVHLISGLCAVTFAILSFLTSQSLIYSLSGDVAPSRAVQIIAFNIAAFLLVALLAGRMADRRKLGDELKRAESDFADLNVLHERILSSIDSGLITTDLQGKIRAFNRAAERLSGISAVDAIGRSVLTIFGDELRPSIEMSLSGVQNLEFTPPNFEAALRHSNNGNGSGHGITVACSVSPLVGRSGGVTGLIISFQDTTYVHAMQENLRRADRLSAVGRMAAGLAHEIRNPLGSISSAVQFLAEKSPQKSDSSALMNVVVRESDRLNRIISDFLAYARPDSTSLQRNIADVDCGEAIEDCLALLRHDPAVRAKHRFDFESPKAPISIESDEVHIKQVIWNLLQNSIQAMPDGGTLSVMIDEPKPGFARIRFIDDGCGIDSAELENIYEPFRSGSRGTGLGLSIVHRIVTEGGGRIDVESEKGAGTTITVELPKQYAHTIDR